MMLGGLMTNRPGLRLAAAAYLLLLHLLLWADLALGHRGCHLP